jgi:type II secretory pathway component PulC
VSIPARESIKPTSYKLSPPKESIAVDITKIYEDDLFGTYSKELPAPKDEKLGGTFPQPPAPHEVPVAKPAPPQFLEPLDVSLKGIMVISHSNARNGAIIENNKTNVEKNYQVGDNIEDAQLIRIFSNKIVFLRSNGQQEVLYLREQDAKIDPAFAVAQDWNRVVQEVTEGHYLLNPKAFGKRIHNLAEFIDMFNLVTAYRKGVSVGVQIGRVDQRSLGAELALQTGDLITTINGMPTGLTEDRIKIYKEITNISEGGTITVELSRRGQPRTLVFTLKEFKLPEEGKEEVAPKIKKLQEEEKAAILKEKHKFAPTLYEIENQERRNMLRRGEAPQEKTAPQENE